jgi:hypothetical protein
MKDSIKANLIVFSLIAIVSFAASSAIANLTIPQTNDSYKLVPLEDDSFTPAFIEEVPTIIPEVKNTTNSTNSTNKTLTTTIEEWSSNYTNLTNLLKPLVDTYD